MIKKTDHPSKPVSFPSSNSFQRRRTIVPSTKLNNVDVNSRTNGLTVTSLMYDSSSKKMVTWKDTVRRTAPDEVEDKMGDEKSSVSNCYVKEGNAKSTKTSELTCRATQSEKLRKRKDKIQCDKILSCNDVLHKDQPKKIPLSKYSFKSRLNATGHPVKRDVDVISLDSNTTITVKSSGTDLEDSNVDVDNSSSCNSVANSFRKLKIDIEHDLKSEASSVLRSAMTENLESDSLVEISLTDVKCEDEGARTTESDFDCPQNAHKEMSKWFDQYVKESEGENCTDNTECEKSGEEIETLDKVESFANHSAEEKEPNENLVLLFKSHTDLDLTKRTSNFGLTGQRSEGRLEEDPSEETFVTNCDLDSVQLSCRRPSHFSLKKSSSDICLGLGGVHSNAGCSSRNTLVSIYRNKNREAWDEESLTDNRKAVSSLPNIPINDSTYKNETDQEIKSASFSKTKISKQNELLRRKILEVAAKEFVKDCRGESADQKVHQREGSNSEDTFLKFIEEEYTVPKKRRKVDNTYSRKKRQKIFRFSVLQNFDLATFKALTVSGDGNVLEYRNDFHENGAVKAKDEDSCSEASSLSSVRSDGTLCGSSTTARDYSPRIFAILDNVLNGGRGRPVDDKSLVVMTSSDCRRLIDLDREKLPELQRHLKKIKKQGKRYPGALRLPAIENREGVSREDKEIQVDGVLSLPKIMDKKLSRRDNVKKLEVDVRRDIGAVYLEYDGER